MTRAGSPGRAAASRRGSQRARQVEDRLHVERQHLVPGGVRDTPRSGAPQLAPALFTSTCSARSRARELVGERAALGLAAESPPAARRRCRASRAPPRPRSHVLGLARRDVDARAALDEAARDHQADAARAAGHERHLALDREELRRLHVPPRLRAGSRRARSCRWPPPRRASPRSRGRGASRTGSPSPRSPRRRRARRSPACRRASAPLRAASSPTLPRAGA